MSPDPADTPKLRKERGAFFTPPEISRFIVGWAIQHGSASVLEPSCGEASFLLPAADRLRQLSGHESLFAGGSLHGVELHGASAKRAEDLLTHAGADATIEVADFFDVEPNRKYDAVVGNPPYIRYQNFSGELRAKALRAALSQGVRLTRLANSWAAFVVHASRFLKPEGRLGLVLPAELLTVNYAAPLRSFLLSRFAKVRLVTFEKLVFPGVLEEVVLLLAEGSGPSKCFEVYQATDASALADLDSTGWSGFAPQSSGKWTAALLTTDSFAEYQQLAQGPAFSRLFDWGETSLGAVTGNNRFFALTATAARQRRIPKSALLPISPPGSRHLRGLSFASAAWEKMSQDGAACYLFYPSNGRIGSAVTQYIEEGEAAGVHEAYKCRVRKPWWRVPVVPIADLLLTYMDHDRPRLVTNAAKVAHLNSLYGVSLRSEFRKLGRDLLPIASLNSVTLLGAEVVGRSYGGGMLKLEPREADSLPVPSPAAVRQVAPELRALRPQLAKWLRQGKTLNAVELVDRVVLRDHLDASSDQIGALREARELLFSRRMARARGANGKS